MIRTVELRSGTWRWSPESADVENGENDGGPLATRLELRRPDSPRSVMVVRVPPHLGGAGDEAAVAAAAENPLRRSLEGPDGQRWSVWPVDASDAASGDVPRQGRQREVRAQREGAEAVPAMLPAGRSLGQLTDDELLELVG